MSTTNIKDIPGSQKKPLTAGFQLETKIRLIIQEVLTATVRKLSLFGEKVEKFQEYFITFKERFQSGERQRGQLKDEMLKITDMQSQIRRQMNIKDVKYSEDRERDSILQKETKQQIRQLQKSVKTLLRQNQNINLEMSKTKSKFLQYSNTITTMKEEVSWKITKYLEETAQSHTQMKVASQDIKIQNFNMNLQIDKQKEKYDNIILKYEEDLVFRQETKEKLDNMNAENNKRMADHVKLNGKLDDVELAMLSRIKSMDVKFEDKMGELDKNNSKLTSVFKKIDNFNALLQGVKNDIDENAHAAANSLEQSMKRMKDYTDDEVFKAVKEEERIDKKIDKTTRSTEEKIQKLQDFLLQKLEFMKMEVENDLSSKTTKMLQQKSKTEQHLNSSSMEQINSKMAKFQFQTAKNIGKVEGTLKEQIVEVKREVDRVRDDIDSRVQENMASGKYPAQHVPSQRISSNLGGEFNLLKEQVKEIRGRTEQLEAGKQALQQKTEGLRRKVEDKFLQSDQKLNTKVEKVMFLVTKMRGDSIIRNQFNDKQIRELKKGQHEMRDRMELTWKLLPGIGECVNTIMSIIFDAQFQHSKIIQDNLPMLAKDVERFNTCNEGVIYEFKERKKPGIICYRHNQIKKTDLVRATFFGYIQLWEEVLEAQVKNKQQLMPKNFYKRLVEKQFKPGKAPEKEGGLSQFTSVQQMRTSGNMNQISRSETSDGMNTSFHIRKKKTVGSKGGFESLMGGEIKE